MATLNEVMKDTADAIREKKGTSEKIAPINFAEEIKSISAGGGESGGSNVEYLDLSGFPTEPVMFLSTYSILCRVSASGGEGVLTTAIMMQNPTTYTIKYVAIDFSLEIAEGKMKASIKDALIAKGFTQEDFDSIPRITKEQFYDLNA